MGVVRDAWLLWVDEEDYVAVYARRVPTSQSIGVLVVVMEVLGVGLSLGEDGLGYLDEGRSTRRSTRTCIEGADPREVEHLSMCPEVQGNFDTLSQYPRREGC